MRRLRRPVLIGVAIFITLIIYAYGFEVTQVSLDEVRSERRQTSLVRIVRALARPDILAYEKVETTVETPFMEPCPPGGFTPEIDKSGPYIIVTPTCADPKTEVTVEGFGFEPDLTGPLGFFVASSEVTLNLGTIHTGDDGHFVMVVKVPERLNEEPNFIRATTRRNVGYPHFTPAAYDTFEKIIETIFLALLATTFGTFLAMPLSFLAARNLMKDITSPIAAIGLGLIAVPLGVLAGALFTLLAGRLASYLTTSLLLNTVALLVAPLPSMALARWAFPQEETALPSRGLKAARAFAAAVAVFILMVGLYLLGGLAINLGSLLAEALGFLDFIGSFIKDVGDIVVMLLPVVGALIGAGVVYAVTGRVGVQLAHRMTGSTKRIVNLLIAAGAGAMMGYLLGAGLNWLYQFRNGTEIIFWSTLISAGLGAFMALTARSPDAVPIGMSLYYLSRTIFNGLRAIEVLIWVIIFVVWIGIGPFAGVLALTLHTAASLAKLYSEQVESIVAGPIEAIKATGANRLQTIVYAVIPQVIPPFISFTMYRWDINVRMSTIIGFAGGGGIGFLLQQNINLLNYRAASVQMLAIAIVVALMDYLSSVFREKTV
jgi:phosphonate ABC transporter permease subunit PhnE